MLDRAVINGSTVECCSSQRVRSRQAHNDAGIAELVNNRQMFTRDVCHTSY